MTLYNDEIMLGGDFEWMSSMLMMSNGSTNGTVPSFTEGQQIALLASRAIIGSLSFSFTLVYVLYILGKSLYTFPWRRCFRREANILSTIQSECYLFSRPIGRIFFILILCECIAITYVFFELAGFEESDHFVCYYQGFVIQFFGLLKYGYNLIIAIYMLYILAMRKQSKLMLIEICSHLVNWIFALTCTIIPIAFNEFGWAGSYCWIKPTTRGTYLRFATHYIPLWTIIGLVCCIYVVTLVIVIRRQWLSFRVTAREKQLRHISTSMRLYIKMMGFPVVFVVLWIAPTIRRLMDALHKPIPFSLVFVHSITSPAMGFWYTVVLILSSIMGKIFDSLLVRYGNAVVAKKELQIQNDDDYAKWEDTEDASLKDDI